jgi:prepilin-type N-terminal cleavage/methylation domain-containing protein
MSLSAMRSPPTGLTLIELLVTLAVLSVLSIMSFQALESLVTSRDRLLGQALEQRQTALAFAQMESDLQAFRRLNPAKRRAALRVTPTDQGWVLELPEARWSFERNRLVRRPLQGPGSDRVLMTGLRAANLALVLPSQPDQLFEPGRAWNWPDSAGLAGLKVSVSRSSGDRGQASAETVRVFLLGRPSARGG